MRTKRPKHTTAKMGPKSLILATAAHDLRNPLSAVIGYAEALLMEVLDQKLSVRQRELINRIRGASLRGLELTKNLQSLAIAEKRKHAKQGTSPVMAGVASAIESVWFPPEKILVFSQTSSVDDSVQVGLEQYEIERIVANLLSNAIKFTPAGAQISLGVQRIGKFVRIEVKNTGTFIHASEQKHIFKLFARGTGSQSSVGNLAPGSGLGLAIVASLVKQAKGRVQVVSSPTQTEFFVDLPILKASKSKLPKK